MKFLKTSLFIVIFISAIGCKSTQNNSVNDIVEVIECEGMLPDFEEKKFKKENFPQDWIGNYQGELQVYSVDSIAMNLKMKLDITKKSDSVYNWTITYDFKGKEDIRAYELNIVDAKKGHYIIDEKNSIKIDAFYRNKIFTSFFKVMNSFIVATYTKENDAIIFEIISATDKKTTVTGNTTFNEEEIPEVTTYFVNGRQKAVLSRE